MQIEYGAITSLKSCVFFKITASIHRFCIQSLGLDTDRLFLFETLHPAGYVRHTQTVTEANEGLSTPRDL